MSAADRSAGVRHVLSAPRRRAGRLVRRARRWWRDGPAPERQWVRQAMLADIRSVLTDLPTGELDAAECSSSTYADLGWHSHTRLVYPDFDLVAPPASFDRFDVVICEQVLEHVTDPFAAARTLQQLCRPGGHVIVSTPFLLKIHAAPADYWRFTPDGLRIVLEAAGLAVERVESWGNRTAVVANLWRWAAARRWYPRGNRPSVPTVVWAICRRP